MVRQVAARDHRPVIAPITLFELLAQGAKPAAQEKAEPERILSAVEAVLKDESLEKLDPYDVDASRLAIELRRHHSEFVDCTVLAAVVTGAQALLTEDSILLAPDAQVKSLIPRVNPRFKTVSFKQLGKANPE